MDTTSNLYKLGYRYYDSTTKGRFTQQDPSGKEANSYAYAGGDPINSADPGGLFGFNNFIRGVGYGIAGIGTGYGAVVGVAACPETLGAGCAPGIASGGVSIYSFANEYNIHTRFIKTAQFALIIAAAIFISTSAYNGISGRSLNVSNDVTPLILVAFSLALAFKITWNGNR